MDKLDTYKGAFKEWHLKCVATAGSSIILLSEPMSQSWSTFLNYELKTMCT